VITVQQDYEDESNLIRFIVGGLKQDHDIFFELAGQHSLPIYFHFAFMILIQFSGRSLLNEFGSYAHVYLYFFLSFAQLVDFV